MAREFEQSMANKSEKSNSEEIETTSNQEQLLLSKEEQQMHKCEMVKNEIAKKEHLYLPQRTMMAVGVSVVLRLDFSTSFDNSFLMYRFLVYMILS